MAGQLILRRIWSPGCAKDRPGVDGAMKWSEALDPRPISLQRRQDDGDRDYSAEEMSREMDILRLFPYWLDTNKWNAILSDVNIPSLFILTGPNGGGKSSMLCSVYTAALLGICGLMVPAASAVISHLNSIMMHMKVYAT